MYQKTIARQISFTGIGLHLGKKVNVTIRPANVDHGIIFLRTDTPEPVEIKANAASVVDTKFATTLGYNGVKISTVEHLLAAFMGLGIDNVLVEIDSSEVPIMDGSASPFVYLLKTAGIRAQKKPKKFLVIKRVIKVSDGDKRVILAPFKGLKITYTVDFDHPLIANQSYSAKFCNGTFEREISRARTFGFLKDVEVLKANGLAKGGSLDNAIVVGDFRIINEDGLRFHDEFVRHKILDSIGDLSLLGVPVIGHLIAYKSGHSLNYRLMKKVISNKKNWKLIEVYNEEFDRYNVPSFELLKQVPASA
ncbi:MAG: UDP-3-O-acyl-N-acetylglucosamine deacetylase [Thermodesulfobacteriota bacterium]